MPEFHALASFLLISRNRKNHCIMEKDIKNEELNEEIHLGHFSAEKEATDELS